MDYNSTSILVVDDNEETASAYALYFQKVGYFVRTAFTGDEALEILNTCAVDVLISDLSVPSMDGLAQVEAIIANAWWPKLRRIAVTAEPLDEVADKARSSGFEAVFQKPAKMCALVDWIEQNCRLCDQ